VKSVIFNADDFGASGKTNAAIIRAHAEGILTSASLMVGEPGAVEAIRLAEANPSLAIGLHVVLSNGLCTLPANSIPHLASSNGRFREDPAAAGMRMFFSSAARREVAQEVGEQFRTFAETGLPWSHVDGHQHLHMHPVVWDCVVRCCEEYGVRRIRIPYEEFIPVSPGRLAARRIEWLFFRVLRKRCLRSLRGKEFTVAERVYGHLETGSMTEEYVLELLGRLQGNTNEIYFHPGTPHAQLMPHNPGMDVELNALLSPAVRARIMELKLRPATYPQLERR
jgi:hopanoid biosynthesis associated protein HpnK